MLKKTKKRKLAIVMSGGGMRCAYGAGALTALAEEFGLVKPAIVIAASGSAGNAAYYVAGQYTNGAQIWTSLANSRFISFRRLPILDIDYLVDEVFRKNHPFDTGAMEKSKIHFLVPLTRVNDGATVYMEPKPAEAIYDYLRAAKAVPVAYGKTVTIQGEEYMDGDFGASTNDFVLKALEEGAEDLIVLESNPGESAEKTKYILMEALWAKGYLKKEPGVMAAALHELRPTPPIVLPEGVRLVTVQPTKKISLKPVTTSSMNLRTAFNLGYDDATNNAELQKLLQ